MTRKSTKAELGMPVGGIGIINEVAIKINLGPPRLGYESNARI